ncbi:MAG: tRNA pseudouridine synthase A, partial [Planctomycetes bacterium]|nr:tRNA pseudouridine synthase A [Planctomycetota bacterium]
MPNVKLIIEYDGTRYCGWQSQKNSISVQQKIEEAVGKAVGEKIGLIGASRTDAGVHARGQVANFCVKKLKIKPDRLPHAINFYLPSDIAVISSERVNGNFNARRCARAKLYKY